MKDKKPDRLISRSDLPSLAVRTLSEGTSQRSLSHGGMVQFLVPGSRFPVPGSRFPVPGSRFPVPGSRFPVPGSRSLSRSPWSSDPAAGLHRSNPLLCFCPNYSSSISRPRESTDAGKYLKSLAMKSNRLVWSASRADMANRRDKRSCRAAEPYFLIRRACSTPPRKLLTIASTV